MGTSPGLQAALALIPGNRHAPTGTNSQANTTGAMVAVGAHGRQHVQWLGLVFTTVSFLSAM